MKTTRKTLAPAHISSNVTAQRMPLRQCNNSNMEKPESKLKVHKENILIISSSKVVKSKRTTSAKENDQKNASLFKKQPIKENLVAKQTACDKFLVSSLKKKIFEPNDNNQNILRPSSSKVLNGDIKTDWKRPRRSSNNKKKDTTVEVKQPNLEHVPEDQVACNKKLADPQIKNSRLVLNINNRIFNEEIKAICKRSTRSSNKELRAAPSFETKQSITKYLSKQNACNNDSASSLKKKNRKPNFNVDSRKIPLLSSKKVLNGEIKIDCKRSTQSSNKRQKVALSFEKKQSIKENFPAGIKKSLCYKFTSSPVNCENDNALDVYDIYLDKDIEDTGCTKKRKRKVKRKEPVVVRAKTPHAAKTDNVCPLQKANDSLKNMQNTCPIAENVDDLTSAFREPKPVSFKSSKDVDKVSITNTHNAGLKATCTNTNNLSSEKTTDMTSDLQQQISNIQNYEVGSCQKQTVPSNPIILKTSYNSVDKSCINAEQNQIGTQCSGNVDFYSEFESSFSILEMMHSTPEKVTSSLCLTPNNQRICKGINDIISPILKNISPHVAGIDIVQGNGCVNLYFDAESKKRKIVDAGISPLKVNTQVSAEAKKKQVATNKNDCTHSLEKRNKTTRTDKAVTCPITGRVLTQTVINFTLDAETNENLEQGNNPMECCEPHFAEITLYESPVKTQETDKSNRSLEKSTRKIPVKRLLETSNKYLENSEDDDYGSIHLFEDCSLPKLKRIGSPMQEVKEKVLKPKRAYHTPEQFRRHIFKSKRAGVIAVQKKKTDTKLDHWASSLNDHFEEIEKINLCVE